MIITKETQNKITTWKNEQGSIYSIIPPPEEYCFNFFLPETEKSNILQLGSCGNTFRFLLKQIYPNTKLTDVDIEDYSEFSDNFVLCDARDFIKNTSQIFDYSVVDLATTQNVCEFIFEKEFQENLKKISYEGVINAGNYENKFSYLNCIKSIKSMSNNLIFWRNK